MATKDTVVQELVVNTLTHKQFKAAQEAGTLSPYELYGTPDTSVRLPVLTPMWFDHLANDVSWLRADTFSWHSGDVYVAAYEHLVADFDGAVGVAMYAWYNATYGLWFTLSENPSVGDYMYSFTDTTNKTISQFDIISSVVPGVSVSLGSDVFERLSSGDKSNVPGIDTFPAADGYYVNVSYMLAQDGHKICLPNQESNLVALYETTGVAWYYILDTDNQQFKLPRTKFGFTGLRDSVGNVSYTAAIAAVPDMSTGASIPSGWVAEYDCVGYCQVASGNNKKGTVYVNGIAVFHYSGGDYPKQVGAQWIVPKGSTVTFSGDWSTAPTVYKLTPNAPATQMYLYFWVGAFDQTATEQTAGLNAELFNNKADRDLMNTTDNVDIVVESQLPTADNGYTWYRKYKSGWVVQGGQTSVGEVANETKSVSLPVEMNDGEYWCSISWVGREGNSGAYSGVTKDNSSTATTLVLKCWTTAVHKCYWQVSGMAA